MAGIPACGRWAEALHSHSLRPVPPLSFPLHNRYKDTARLCDATTPVARIELLCETAIGALGDNGCEWESLPRPPYPRLPLAHRLGAGLITSIPSSFNLIEAL